MNNPNALRRRSVSSRSSERGSSLDSGNPQHVELARRKLEFTTDSRPTFVTTVGVQYGVVGDKVVPLWNMYAGSFFRCRENDGYFETRSTGFLFRTHPETDEVLKTLINPFNGATLDVVHFKTGIVVRKLSTAGWGGALALDQESEPTTEPRISITMQSGNDIWVQRDYRTPNLNVYELVVLQGHVSDILAPDVPSAPCRIMAHNVSGWYPWMKMEDAAGSVMARMVGRKVFNIGDMNARFLEFLRAQQPQVFDDPLSVLGSFED